MEINAVKMVLSIFMTLFTCLNMLLTAFYHVKLCVTKVTVNSEVKFLGEL